jgi:2-oxoisovalerate dehydrogenase E1 component alpha subunit
MTPHSSDDDDRSYRSREEIEKMKEQDPLEIFRMRLLKEELITDDEEESYQHRAMEEVEGAMKAAEEAPFPEIADARGPVYAQEDSHA